MPRSARFAALCLLALAACTGGGGPTAPGTPTPVTPTPPDTAPPTVRREFRGLWIATVANIDWPSKAGLSAQQQQAELVSILDRAATMGINAIVFHVRPAADAVYQSSLEPWASMLTGIQGTDPGYDPLAFAVTEAHRRGMELHAWINPFRAGSSKDSLNLARSHVFWTNRNLVRVYGSNLWVDPGEPAVQDRVITVLRDIATRYDVDAMHMDDFFYPYQILDAQNRVIDFPDTATYRQYGGGVALADWRRANVDRFVERMYREMHEVKPQLKVGISPFGIWRPGNPVGITGLDAYATIYADSRKWLQQGWVDYFAPQLYWAIDPPNQSFPALLDWWMAQNTRGRHVWPGLASYKVNDGTASSFTVNEIINQVKAIRQRPQGTGMLFYNTTWTLSHNGGEVASGVRSNVFTDFAVSPAYSWLDAQPPAEPTVSVVNGGGAGATVTLTPAPGDAVRWWVIRWRGGAQWKSQVVFGATTSVTLLPPAGNRVDRVMVQAADAAWNLSPVVDRVVP